jgi:hypothetical protein
MYSPRELSNFNAVRAIWEARDREQTLPKPPVAVSKLTPLQALPNGMRRLSSRSFTMFNGQLNPFRSRASTRGRQSSTDIPNAITPKTSFKTPGSRDSSGNIVPKNPRPQLHRAPYTVLTTPIPDYSPPPLPKSRTTSFLPIPSKPATTSPVKSDPEEQALVHSQSTRSLFRSRIPTPSGFREQTNIKSTRNVASRAFAGLRKPSSSRFQRSITQPNLITATGRKASEFARKGASKYDFSEDAVPLLETTAEEDEGLISEKIAIQGDAADRRLKYVPKRQVQFPHQLDEYPHSNEWNRSRDFEYEFVPSASATRLIRTNSVEALRTAQRVKSCAQRTEPSLTSNRVIQCHQLLSPILPQSPTAPFLPAVHEQMQLSPIATHQDADEMSQQSARSKRSNPEEVEEESKESEGSPSLRCGTTANPIPLHKQVSQAQPAAYWAGRFMSLKDSILNNSFDLHHRLISPSDTESSNTSSTSLIFLPVNKESILTPEVQQAKQIFDMLELNCTTEAAVRSLLDFRNAWANKHRLPSVQRYLPWNPRPNSWVPGLVEEELAKATDSQGSSRKLSFIERLKMRSRKSSGKSE